MTEKNHAEEQSRAQVSSIVEMVAALTLDYDRLQELREKAQAGHYVAGFNAPGYMPDSTPAAFDTCDEARDYIADEIDRAAESLEDSTHPTAGWVADDENEQAKAIAAALREDAQKMRDSIGDADAEFGATLGGTAYWITHIPGKLADEEEQKELDELNEAAGECSDADEARQRIEEDALSVEVRSGWHSLGETLTPDEFRIVLCTGGPHVEIVGELDEHSQPDSVRILYRDWGTGGELFDFDREAVLTYSRQFYFGE